MHYYHYHHHPCFVLNNMECITLERLFLTDCKHCTACLSFILNQLHPCLFEKERGKKAYSLALHISVYYNRNPLHSKYILDKIFFIVTNLLTFIFPVEFLGT